MEHYGFSAAEVTAATDAALDALAWTTPVPTDSGDDSWGYLDNGLYDWSDAARESMRETVDAFMSDDRVSRLFDLLTALGVPFTPEQIGHDFILTANGHGAGFWDRDYRPRPKAALDALSDICRPFGELTAYINSSTGDSRDAQIELEN